MKIGIFTGDTSVRSKNIFTDISRYPTGKHEIKYYLLKRQRIHISYTHVYGINRSTLKLFDTRSAFLTISYWMEINKNSKKEKSLLHRPLIFKVRSKFYILIRCLSFFDKTLWPV